MQGVTFIVDGVFGYTRLMVAAFVVHSKEARDVAANVGAVGRLVTEAASGRIRTRHGTRRNSTRVVSPTQITEATQRVGTLARSRADEGLAPFASGPPRPEKREPPPTVDHRSIL